jgi:Domain of unknown function (DUF4260)
MAMYRSLVITPTAGASPDPNVRTWLRLEGVAAFVAGIVIFGRLGGAWPWLVPAILLVDLSMAGYLGGPRLGAFVYNFAHQWAVALVVLGLGLAADVPQAALAGAVLVAHVGMDRALGYGLKLPSAFGDTHLGRIGRR